VTDTKDVIDNETSEGLEGGDQIDVAKVVAERDGYLDQLQRSVAEFANYRRRVEGERVKARELATRGILLQILPLVDDLQRALGAVPAESADASWVQGVQLIERKLAALLEREGVVPINETGQPFDPALHEAVATEPGSSQNVVVEVYQTGYRQGDQVLRPAMVKVGDAPTMHA
jgi:molecular chaperone GrpE